MGQDTEKIHFLTYTETLFASSQAALEFKDTPHNQGNKVGLMFCELFIIFSRPWCSGEGGGGRRCFALICKPDLSG